MEAYLLRVHQNTLSYYSNYPEEILKTIQQIDHPELLNVDQAWDGITFLLTGDGLKDTNTHPLKHLWMSINKPLSLPSSTLPQGLQVLYPDEVQNLSDLLNEAVLKDPLSAYNAEKMSSLNISPNFWLIDEEEDLPTYLMEYLEELNNFYFAAAELGQAIIILLY